MYFFLANGWLARQKLGVNWKEGGFEPPTSQGLSFFSFQLQFSGPWFIGWLWGAMMWHLRRRSLGWQRSNPSSSAAFASITPAGAAHGQGARAMVPQDAQPRGLLGSLGSPLPHPPLLGP